MAIKFCIAKLSGLFCFEGKTKKQKEKKKSKEFYSTGILEVKRNVFAKLFKFQTPQIICKRCQIVSVALRIQMQI